MDKLQSMRLFLKVVETGSFTGAAELFGTHTAVVSRAIADLESRLRTRLLNRTTRRTAPTEAGKRYASRCAVILEMVDAAEGEAGDANMQPTGRLRLHAYTGVGHHYVIPSIASYEARYPDVNVDLTLSQRNPDLIEEGFDAAVMLAERLPDSGLIAQRLGVTGSILCASPSFVGRHGEIRIPEDLERLPCAEVINPLFASGRWTLHREGDAEPITVPVKGRFRVNVAESMAAALEQGMSVGALPAYSALKGLRDGTLVRVLPEYTLHPIAIFIVYPSTRYLDAKIRTWVDHLKEEMPRQLSAERAVLGAGSQLVA